MTKQDFLDTLNSNPKLLLDYQVFAPVNSKDTEHVIFDHCYYAFTIEEAVDLYFRFLPKKELRKLFKGYDFYQCYFSYLQGIDKRCKCHHLFKGNPS